MNFLSKIFHKKSIVKTEILNVTDGLSEDEELENLVIGDMEYGFEGAVTADVYNSYHTSKTTFKVYFDNGTSKVLEVETDSHAYHYYLQFLK